MSKVTKNKKYVVMIVLLVLVIVFSFSNYFVFVGTNAVINAIAVMGIVIISGYAKQLHLGQSAFLGIGAYVAAIMMTKVGISFWLTIPAAMIISGIFGWILSIPTLKLKGGSYLALVTQIFGEIIYVLLLNLTFLTNGPFGITGIQAPKVGPINFVNLQPYFFLCVGFMLLVYLALKRIVHTKYGRFFMAIRESEDAARSIGINTRRYKMTAFVIATSIAGLAGVLYGPFIGYLSPEQFRWQPSLILVSMAIVGGLTSLEGGIIGSILLTFLPELLRSTDQLRMILYGVVVILTLAFLPNGIISLVGKKPGEMKTMLSKQWDTLSDKSLKKKKKRIRAAMRK